LRQAFHIEAPLSLIFEAPAVAETAVAIELMLIE
jgi:hypothetical protein